MDQTLVECCPTSNTQTGAVPADRPHPLLKLLEHDVPIAICTDNTTVSRTHQLRETQLVSGWLGENGTALCREIHARSRAHSFIRAAREGARA